MSGLSPKSALEQLKPREPIFHRRSYGTSRDALEAMTDDAFWEVGASGRVYNREYVISTLLERYKGPEPHDWPCSDFSIHELAENLFLLHYTLNRAGSDDPADDNLETHLKWLEDRLSSRHNHLLSDETAQGEIWNILPRFRSSVDLRPEDLTTLLQFSVSSARNLPNSAGELGNGA